MNFSSRSLFLARLRDHLHWILRRAGAGFTSGLVAWFFIPALSRVFSQESTAFLYFLSTGLLGGAFLGAVDGMVEESTPKTVRGAIWGGFGGALGGVLFGSVQGSLTPQQLPWGFFCFWAVAGGFIGLVSPLWEKQPRKIIAGALAGVIGGGIGGALGIVLYYTMIRQYAPVGVAARFMEALSGGIIGITLWFFIGAAERFVVFKRRQLGTSDTKVCDHCDTKNPLNMWYCGSCGSVLQQSAPPAKLNLSPFSTLDRLRDAFRFLSRLAATTGFIAGAVVFMVFLPVNPFLAFVALVVVAVASYSLSVLFSAVEESLKIFVKR